jgi:hypothetical protein
MRMISLAAAVLAVSLTINSAAHAQEPATPSSTCSAAVKRAEDSVWLRVQGGGRHAVAARESAKLHLYEAETSAASGNDAECWRQLQLSSIGY